MRRRGAPRRENCGASNTTTPHEDVVHISGDDRTDVGRICFRRAVFHIDLAPRQTWTANHSQSHHQNLWDDYLRNLNSLPPKILDVKGGTFY